MHSASVMFLWFCACTLALFSLTALAKSLAPSIPTLFAAPAEARRWQGAALEIRAIESRLESGQGWGEEECLPWETRAPVFVARALETARRLRERGTAVLPYLERIRAECARNAELLSRASEESAGARAQAGACLLLFPLFIAALTVLLPNLRERSIEWGMCSLFAVSWGAVGYFWMLHMSAQAQWGGLAPERRAWIFFPAQVGTTLLSEIQGGMPGDLAWTQVFRQMSLEDRIFAARMGSTLWSPPPELRSRSRPGILEILERAIEDQRRILAHAVLEGRSSAESLERLLDQVQEEIRCELSRGIRRLGTRALLPLFLCVAPGFFVLLAGAIFLGGVLG